MSVYRVTLKAHLPAEEKSRSAVIIHYGYKMKKRMVVLLNEKYISAISDNRDFHYLNYFQKINFLHAHLCMYNSYL